MLPLLYVWCRGLFGAFFFDMHLVSEVLQISVITEQVASVLLLMRYHSKEHIGVHLFKLPNHCLGNSFFEKLL